MCWRQILARGEIFAQAAVGGGDEPVKQTCGQRSFTWVRGLEI
jgi:hypothetical protein